MKYFERWAGRFGARSLVSRKNVAVLLAALFFFGTGAPLFAWYYFTASNGDRKAWVFNSSCNSGNSSINLYLDSDTPSSQQTSITCSSPCGTLGSSVTEGVINDWNTAAGTTLINTSVDTSTTMDADAVVSYHNNPTAGRIWVVYDDTGDVFSRFGIDPDSGVLGIGLSYSLDSANPQNICSGMVLINAKYINAQSSDSLRQYKITVLHEIGHSMGFAHSISAGNSSSGLVVTNTMGVSVMYPFSYGSASTETLRNDDKAGARAVYGP